MNIFFYVYIYVLLPYTRERMLVETASVAFSWLVVFLLRRGHTNKNKHTKLFFLLFLLLRGWCSRNDCRMEVNTAMVLYLCFMHAVYSQRMPNNTNLRLSFIFLVETRNTYTYLLCVFVFLISTYSLQLAVGRYSEAVAV